MTSFLSSGFGLGLAGIALFGAVLLLVNGLYAVWSEQVATRKMAADRNAGEAGLPRLAVQDDLLQEFARFVTPTDSAELSAIRIRLARAGFRRPSAPRVFYLARAISPLAGLLLGVLAITLIKLVLPLPIIMGLLFFPLLLGLIAPAWWVDRCAANRKADAEGGFPDVLDMLLICIEAGQSFDQACRRVSREVKRISPTLYEELNIVNEELWAGRDRGAAFRDFATRIGATDINAFVTVLRQSDEFGVSIADALRVYAADMRNKRLMRAEEKANLMPLKLALGSMFFTIPPTMMIMAGPSLLMIMRAFQRMGGG